MSADVVIAVAVPTRAHGGDRVLQIARWLVRRGVSVEFVAMGEGTRPETSEFRAVAPLTVVDRFRRRGVARVPHLLGMRRVSTGWKRTRLRRWMSSRSGATFLLHDPLTASLLRYSPMHPRRVVASLPDSSWTLGQARPEDRESLADADGWVVSSELQASEVTAAGFDGPVVVLGSAESTAALIDRSDLPAVTTPAAGPGTAVLLSPIGLWDAVDHAIEIAWRLHRAVPALRLRWVVDTDADRWLARHDVEHAGLGDVVKLTTSDDPDVLSEVTVVVRTGYDATQGELALAAALGGVPVEGTCVSDLTERRRTEPFAVDALVADLVELLGDPAARAARGAALRAELAHLDIEHHIDAVTSLLGADRP